MEETSKNNKIGQLEIVEMIVKKWKHTDKYPCPKCGDKLEMPGYKCDKCNVKLKLRMQF